MTERNSHCHCCGTKYEQQDWPRTCTGCNNMAWRPISPVSVILVPVVEEDGRIGILVGKRGINPQKGQFGLPGGFVEFAEKGEDAALRELFEETGIHASLKKIVSTMADDQGHFLTFYEAEPLPRKCLNMFRSCHECPEIDVVYQPVELAFDSHSAALLDWFLDYAIWDGYPLKRK